MVTADTLIINDLDRIEEITGTIEIDPLPDHFNPMGHNTHVCDLKSLAALVELGRDYDTTIPLTYLEVGSWAGSSALAVASRPNVEVHCVDHWNGSAGGEAAAHKGAISECEDPEGAFGIFKKNTEGYNITPHRGSSLEMSKDGIGRKVDILFIDADHSYEKVCLDLRAWSPHVRSGGILCGHDYSFEGVHKAVREFGHDASIWFSIWYKRMRYRPIVATEA